MFSETEQILRERGVDVVFNELRAENARLKASLQKVVDALGHGCNQPHLGLATNRQLLDELSARIEVQFGLDYRTVDDV